MRNSKTALSHVPVFPVQECRSVPTQFPDGGIVAVRQFRSATYCRSPQSTLPVRSGGRHCHTLRPQAHPALFCPQKAHFATPADKARENRCFPAAVSHIGSLPL